MRKTIFCMFSMLLLAACGNNSAEKSPSSSDGGNTAVKKERKAPVEKIDSTQMKIRQEEIIREDSIQRANEEKKLRQKQECATKVVFLENFYYDYFNKSPRSAVEQYCSDRLLAELRSQAHQYEGNAMPLWVFSSGNGAGNITYRVNIPESEASNDFTIDINSGGQRSKVYLTVIGRDGYYYIDKVKNPTEGY